MLFNKKSKPDADAKVTTKTPSQVSDTSLVSKAAKLAISSGVDDKKKAIASRSRSYSASGFFSNVHKSLSECDAKEAQTVSRDRSYSDSGRFLKKHPAANDLLIDSSGEVSSKEKSDSENDFDPQDYYDYVNEHLPDGYSDPDSDEWDERSAAYNAHYSSLHF